MIKLELRKWFEKICPPNIILSTPDECAEFVGHEVLVINNSAGTNGRSYEGVITKVTLRTVFVAASYGDIAITKELFDAGIHLELKRR